MKWFKDCKRRDIRGGGGVKKEMIKKIYSFINLYFLLFKKYIEVNIFFMIVINFKNLIIYLCNLIKVKC